MEQNEATVMVTGLIDSAVTMRLREKPDPVLLKANGDVLDKAVKRCNGIVMGKAEDGLLVAFNDPLSALRCAECALHYADEYNLGKDEMDKLWLRMAIHHGQTIEKATHVEGPAVEIAARMLGMAPAGGACFLKSIFTQIAAETAGKVQELGPRKLPPLTADAEVISFIPDPKPAEDLKAEPVAPPPAPEPAPAAPIQELAPSAGITLQAPPPQAAPPPPAPAPAPVPQAPPEPETLIGKDLGPCRIEAIIGRGGMGVVFRGRHLRLDRPVAVKVLTPSNTQSQAAAELLMKEARTVAQLEDPRIVQVYDVGSDGPWHYIVMQLLQGETLTDMVVRRGKLPQKEARALMREVLLGLMAAHKRGIIHRDLKPSNIMIDKAGAVKLMDFGIAGSAGKEDFSPDASFSGSFDFMAPEQAFGSAPDPRMDLYAFGATYFFVLAGRPPFSGQNAMEIMVKQRDAPVPDVRQLSREVTPSAAQLIMRLMAKRPEARPASAEEVLHALDSVGMVVEVDASGSPFRILPAPVEEKVGLAAELEAASHETVVAGVAGAEDAEPPPPPAAARADGPLPDPPPPVAYNPGKASPQTWGVLAGLFVIFCGTSWTVLGHGDWAAAGLAAMVCAGLLAWSGAFYWQERAAGPALFVAALYCFLRYGAKPGEGFPPPVPCFEVVLISGLGLALGGAGVFLGFLERQPDRSLGAWLVAGSGVVLLVAGAARALPDAVGWAEGLPPLLGGTLSGLLQTGGLSRWLGLVAVYGFVRLVKLSEFDERLWCRTKSSDGVILNWNK